MKTRFNNYGIERYYTKKSEFIKNICKHLQTLKKNKADYFKCNFNIKENGYHEEWFFDIEISENYKIIYCSCLDHNTKQETMYFSENLKQSSNDIEFNVCKNITEFREFLQREVIKH